jgi:hypothetical protein
MRHRLTAVLRITKNQQKIMSNSAVEPDLVCGEAIMQLDDGNLISTFSPSETGLRKH